MEERFEQAFRVRHCDAALNGALRPSVLLALWQEAGMGQMERLGLGADYTLQRGLLWIVTRQAAELVRLPEVGEAVTLRTWAGEIRHGVFPRHYDMADGAGAVMARAVALWSLLHSDSRTVEPRPQELGVTLPPCLTGTELPRPRGLRLPPPDRETGYTVPYSALDCNGHMNNTRYVDLAEDVFGAGAEGLTLSSLGIEYHREAVLGETLALLWSREGGSCGMEGRAAGELRFRLQMEYR